VGSTAAFASLASQLGPSGLGPSGLGPMKRDPPELGIAILCALVAALVLAGSYAGLLFGGRK